MRISAALRNLRGRPWFQTLVVVSGGQTGADQAGLRVAERLGLSTGGFAPLGWRTEAGPAPWLGTRYGLKQHASRSYRDRTVANVELAGLTAVFDETGGRSPGSKLTVMTCARLHKAHLVNPDAVALAAALIALKPRVLNVAGNREESRPGIQGRVEGVLDRAFSLVRRMELTPPPERF